MSKNARNQGPKSEPFEVVGLIKFLRWGKEAGWPLCRSVVSGKFVFLTAFAFSDFFDNEGELLRFLSKRGRGRIDYNDGTSFFFGSPDISHWVGKENFEGGAAWCLAALFVLTQTYYCYWEGKSIYSKFML